jgi:hypothetical protein
MFPPRTESRAVVAWMQVLDRIEHSLGESLATDLEANIPALPAVSEPGSPLQRLDERLAGLQASLDRAEGNAAEIDTYLQGEAEHLQGYLDNLHEIQRKLADWASRAV